MNNIEKSKIRRKPKELNIQIGERCRQVRDASGYTQEQLVEKIDVSTQFLSDAERGDRNVSCHYH
jgi:DNA-binding XRE family transcriptional regulator